MGFFRLFKLKHLKAAKGIKEIEELAFFDCSKEMTIEAPQGSYIAEYAVQAGINIMTK